MTDKISHYIITSRVPRENVGSLIQHLVDEDIPFNIYPAPVVFETHGKVHTPQAEQFLDKHPLTKAKDKQGKKPAKKKQKGKKPTEPSPQSPRADMMTTLTMRELLWELFKETTEPISVTYLQNQVRDLGRNPKSVSPSLVKLQRNNKIRRVDAGLYQRIL